MNDKETDTSGLIPFELKGDLNKFEVAYMPYFIDKGLSEEDSRNVISSIWVLANSQWDKGYKQGYDNPDFD